MEGHRRSELEAEVDPRTEPQVGAEAEAHRPQELEAAVEGPMRRVAQGAGEEVLLGHFHLVEVEEATELQGWSDLAEVEVVGLREHLNWAEAEEM